jgi:succinyl-CoA synthetase alpha subunit
MSILINQSTKVLVQGVTGREGEFHTEQMLAYGTRVVAVVTPGKGGEWIAGGKVPVFDTVRQAAEATGANCAVSFVPARFAADAMLEASHVGIPLVVCITECIPIKDMISTRASLDRRGTILIGPNCPGLLTPGEAKIGIIPGSIATPGNIGIVSRSGTLTYEVIFALSQKGIGQSTCVGIGGDPIHGLGFREVLALFEEDPQTEKVVLIGEIGGSEEEQAAEYISDHMTKSVVALIAGQTAPPGRTMGHAGAIIEGRAGSASEKMRLLAEAGAVLARYPEEIPDALTG